MTGGTGASRRRANRAAVSLRGDIDGGPRPLHRPILRAQPPLFTHSPLFASQDPLCLSPEDDLRPPARERTWFRRLGETQDLAFLPFIGEDLFSEVERNTGPLRLSPP